MPNRRILSLWFKRLSVERVIRRYRIDYELPIVIIDKKGNKEIVFNLNKAAESYGLFIGQPMRDTILRCPNIVIRLVDLDEDQRFLGLLARWMEKYSPWIKRELPDGILIDITGCAHLFGGERNLVEKLKLDLFKFSLTAQIGIADTVGAAWALSRYMENSSENFYRGEIINQEARATRARAPRKIYKPNVSVLENREKDLDLLKYFIAPVSYTHLTLPTKA